MSISISVTNERTPGKLDRQHADFTEDPCCHANEVKQSIKQVKSEK
jgi:hypothetical protein